MYWLKDTAEFRSLPFEVKARQIDEALTSLSVDLWNTAEKFGLCDAIGMLHFDNIAEAIDYEAEGRSVCYEEVL